MSSTPEEFRRMEELSSLPADDARRQEFVATLSRLDAATQAEWFMLVREAEALRAALLRIDAPGDLRARLLALPDEAPPAIKGSWTQVRIPWPLVAAVLLVVAGVSGYLYWKQDQPVTYATLPAAPQGAVDKITELAVDTHRAARPLDIVSSNRDEVQAGLQAKIGKEMPFPVILPNPGASYRLLGGSVCGFGSGKAIETRWQLNDQVYTLLQFSPADMGMPQQFATLRESPPTQQVAPANYRVTIWPGMPGGACTWAVVSDLKAAPEPFSVSAY